MLSTVSALKDVVQEACPDHMLYKIYSLKHFFRQAQTAECWGENGKICELDFASFFVPYCTGKLLRKQHVLKR